MPSVSSPLADWPAPFRVLNACGPSRFLLTCEHASNHMPAEYAGLGVSEEDRRRHIAWDIGAAALTERLSALLDAPAILSGYSRLLIDLNRPPGVPSSIPQRSEATDIPGNADVSSAERQRRVERMFMPYHTALSALIDDRQKAGGARFIIAVHSFTPVFHGVARPWHVGVLFGRDRLLAEHLAAAYAAEEGIVAGTNVPYVIDRESDYTIPVHGEDRDIPALLLEIRQDLLGDDEGIEAWAVRTARALDCLR